MFFRHATHLVLTFLCAGTASGQDLAVLVAELNVSDAKKRAAAYRQLYRTLPVKAVPLLTAALPGFGYYGRNYGALILARFPFQRARPALAKLLDSGVPFLELTSAVTLHKNADKRVAGRVIDKIITALGQKGVEAKARAAMVRRIAKIETAEVRGAVRQLLVPGVHTSVLAAVLDYLSRAEVGDARTAEIVDGLLRQPKTKGTARALCAAFQVWRGRPEHGATLAKTLGALSVVSSWVWPYLQKSRRLDEAVLAAVNRHALRTKNMTSLTKALDLLVQRDHANLIRTLRKVANKKGPKNKKLAALAYKKLAVMPGALKPKELRGLLAAKPPWLSLFAAETLRRRDDDSGLQTVLDLVHRPGAHRADALRVLGGFRSDAVVAPLIEALNDSKATVRTKAYAALGPVLRGMFPYRRFDLKSTGYSSSGGAGVRQDAVQKIRAWWDANRGLTLG